MTKLDEQTAAADGERHDAPSYDHRAIERRWQMAWQDAGVFLVPATKDTGEQAAYILAEQPVPAPSASLEFVRNYAIGDSYARFLRARGASVLLPLGFRAFGQTVELEAIAHNTTPEAWVERGVRRIGDQLRHLGCSIDPSRVFSSSDPDTYKWTQRVFTTLLENGLIHRAEGKWYLRFSGHLQESQEESFGDWNDLALSSQRASPGFVDGVEFDVASLDGMPLTVFTNHTKAIKQAAFIAISPNHPDIDQWISPPEASGLQPGVALDTGRLAIGVGTEAPLPVIVSAAVDTQFGPTALLGIPALDPEDAKLAEQLSPPSSKAWKITDRGPSEVRPAQRCSDRHIAISHQRGWGAPIPVINCKACGPVPVKAEDLPVRLPQQLPAAKTGNPLEDDEEFTICSCPRCNAPARRETDTLDPGFDALWQWITPCISHAPAGGSLANRELVRWLPVKRDIRGPEHGELLLDQRAGAKALRECGMLSELPSDEPFVGVTMHEHVQKGRPKEVSHLDSLIKSMGADAVRLMVLFGAAPTTVLTWRGHTLQHCYKWLSSLWDYATPRLRKLEELPAIEQSQGAPLRGRLQRWCRTAIERVTENYDELQAHRAARNIMMLLIRIQDFEQRAIDRAGELTSSDERAVAEALLVLVQLIAPLTPHVAEELWAAGGGAGFVASSAWPEINPVVESP